MTVRNFESRLPEGVAIDNMEIDHGHVTVATGHDTTCSMPYGSVLWNQDGLGFIRMEDMPSDFEPKTSVMYCGRLFVRCALYDLKGTTEV